MVDIVAKGFYTNLVGMKCRVLRPRASGPFTMKSVSILLRHS